MLRHVRSIVPGLVAASLFASAPPRLAEAADPPVKAREVVTVGTAPASLTPAERAKAIAAGIHIPPPGEAKSGGTVRWTILRVESLRSPGVRPLEHRTIGERP
jgi:hypothetical protein